LVDENISRDVRKWLVDKGFGVVSVSEIALRGASDRVVAEYASENGLAVLTMDKGFAQIYRGSRRGSLTVIIVGAKPATPANVIEVLSEAQKKVNLKKVENKLVILGKRKIRIIS
jgi:predicted nuclease of predicted toxin-antitoxin system